MNKKMVDIYFSFQYILVKSRHNTPELTKTSFIVLLGLLSTLFSSSGWPHGHQMAPSILFRIPSRQTNMEEIGKMAKKGVPSS